MLNYGYIQAPDTPETFKNQMWQTSLDTIGDDFESNGAVFKDRLRKTIFKL